ncbi:MAG: N-acetylmuramic acid 6-phosphate etherase [Acidobacteriia bacterium]|nr:N-acetylmuramic acid 6-phosphate etherase [Terriglobia bacterium]
MKRRSSAAITEGENPASFRLDTKSTEAILRIINREDGKVPAAIAKVIPQIAQAVEVIAKALAQGGRLIYLGAGTSGRLGVLDAVECPPTFGTDRVVAVMAGAPKALRRATEVTEDNPRQAARDLRRVRLDSRDVLVGISASGRTPYTLGGVRFANRLGAVTIGLTSNPGSPLTKRTRISIVPVVGPEVIAGSTRMKAGTAQKLVLNMLSTASMVRAGLVLSNWMVSVQLTSRKLRERARSILVRATGAKATAAARALEESGGRLPVAVLMLAKGMGVFEASQMLHKASNPAKVLRAALTGRSERVSKNK